MPRTVIELEERRVFVGERAQREEKGERRKFRVEIGPVSGAINGIWDI